MKKYLTLVLILIIIIVIFCIKNIVTWNKDNKNTEIVTEKIKDLIIESGFSKLKSVNQDIIGIIKVKNTNINYPFVKTSDNEFYMNHSLNKEYNNAGWIFMDYRSDIETSYNVILYGHGRYDGTMFGTIKEMLEKNWYNDLNNLIIEIETNDKFYYYQIFSLYVITPEDYYLKVIFNKKSEFLDFLNIIKERSINDFKTEINDTTQILTLSTCIGTKKRAVVHAKLKEIVEKK